MNSRDLEPGSHKADKSRVGEITFLMVLISTRPILLKST